MSAQLKGIFSARTGRSYRHGTNWRSMARSVATSTYFRRIFPRVRRIWPKEPISSQSTIRAQSTTWAQRTISALVRIPSERVTEPSERKRLIRPKVHQASEPFKAKRRDGLTLSKVRSGCGEGGDGSKSAEDKLPCPRRDPVDGLVRHFSRQRSGSPAVTVGLTRPGSVAQGALPRLGCDSKTCSACRWDAVNLSLLHRGT